MEVHFQILGDAARARVFLHSFIGVEFFSSLFTTLFTPTRMAIGVKCRNPCGIRLFEVSVGRIFKGYCARDFTHSARDFTHSARDFTLYATHCARDFTYCARDFTHYARFYILTF